MPCYEYQSEGGAARVAPGTIVEGGVAMKAADPYGMTDKLDDGLLQVVVTRLEARGKHPYFGRMLRGQ